MTDETANPASDRAPYAYLSTLVHRLTPYVQGEQPKLSHLIKLYTI